jgi:N-acetylglucosamine-6-phosphate deacetylase
VIVAGRVVTADEVVTGWVETAGDRITAVGSGSPPAGAATGRGWTIVPGFIDVHVHGGGGHTFTTGEPEAIVAGAEFHLGRGTTTTLLSLVTAPLDELAATAERIARFLGRAGPALRRRIAGIHAEGPFLSAARCGAQDPAAMSDPEPALVDRLVAAAGGSLRMITIAPERRGAVEAVQRLIGAGVVVAIGHSDATFDEAAAAIAAGATVATHLGNAMSPLHHRDPGMVGACLTSAGVCCELIVDGHHLHPSFVRLAAAGKGADGFVLITDAIAAAGVGDGRYRLGRFDVDVSAGVATLVDGGSLAGSTLTMDAAWRNAVAAGIDEVTASRAASRNPARLLGIDGDVGSIETGKRADLVVLGDSGEVQAVIAAGDLAAGTLA